MNGGPRRKTNDKGAPDGNVPWIIMWSATSEVTVSTIEPLGSRRLILGRWMLNLEVNDESSPRTSSTQSSTVRSQVQRVELGKAMVDTKASFSSQDWGTVFAAVGKQGREYSLCPMLMVTMLPPYFFSVKYFSPSGKVSRVLVPPAVTTVLLRTFPILSSSSIRDLTLRIIGVSSP